MTEEDLIKEAKERFSRVKDYESEARKRFIEDRRFANGDSDNLWQWDDTVRNARELDDQPCLTINKTRQHCLQIINDARQNKSSIKVSPTGGDATYNAAQIFSGLIRYIEYRSDADGAYMHAQRMQVEGGIGYIRVRTDYVSDDSFDQDILIEKVKDSLSVYIDPDILDLAGSDAKWAFVFDDMPRDVYEKTYPKYKDVTASLSNDDWIGTDHVRVAEYFKKVEKHDTLMLIDGKPIRRSKLNKAVLDALEASGAEIKSRPIVDHTVEWYKIIGNEVIEKGVWPGKYIPIARVVGEEIIIDGKMDRHGHTRALKDPQRVYNYNVSSAMEHVALQGKSPYMAAVGSIEGLETYYENANRVNYAVLPYNRYNDDGQELPPPERAQPPVMSQAYVQAMQIAAEDMQLVSGQYQAEMGAPSNERSGVAIQQRQRQGDNATYHFIDNFAAAIRFLGRIIIDLAPKIYDTPRVIKIMAEDGSENAVKIDPESPQAHQEEKMQDDQVQVIFNPSVGQYEVEADIGPAFATRRQEAFNAFAEILQHNPSLTSIIGDLMIMNADFPGAEEMAERLKRMVPAQALGDGAPPEVAHLQAQIQTLQELLSKSTEKLSQQQLRITSREEQKDIDVYKAITDRMDVLARQMPSQKDIVGWLHDFNMQERSGDIDRIAQNNQAQIDSDAADQQADIAQNAPQQTQAAA